MKIKKIDNTQHGGKVSVKKWLNENILQQRIVTRLKPFSNSGCCENAIEKGKEFPEWKPECQAAVSIPTVHSTSDDHLSGKLRPGYNVPSITNEHLNRSLAVSYRQPAYFCSLVTDEQFERATRGLRPFRTEDFNRAEIILLIEMCPILCDTMWVYSTADSENGNLLVTDLELALDKALQLKSLTLLLLYLAECQIGALG